MKRRTLTALAALLLAVTVGLSGCELSLERLTNGGAVPAHRHHRDAACILLAGKVLHLVGTEGGKGQVAFGDMLALDAPAAPLDGGLDIIGLPSPVRRPLPRPCAGDAAKALQ